jgi:hypothetical protein
MLLTETAYCTRLYGTYFLLYVKIEFKKVKVNIRVKSIFFLEFFDEFHGRWKVYWQTSQGQMANFSAFIASKSFYL